MAVAKCWHCISVNTMALSVWKGKQRSERVILKFCKEWISLVTWCQNGYCYLLPYHTAAPHPLLPSLPLSLTRSLSHFLIYLKVMYCLNLLSSRKETLLTRGREVKEGISFEFDSAGFFLLPSDSLITSYYTENLFGLHELIVVLLRICAGVMFALLN